MVKCSFCGKEIDKIPSWMQSIDVPYVCTNCPNNNIRNIATIDFMTEILKKPPVEDKSAEPTIVVAEFEEEVEASEE